MDLCSFHCGPFGESPSPLLSLPGTMFRVDFVTVTCLLVPVYLSLSAPVCHCLSLSVTCSFRPSLFAVYESV